MIISRTPLRISFVGGGSDLPSFYRQEPGAVLSTAINKYIYVTVNKKFDDSIRASYSITEIVHSVDELKHELIRESLRMLNIAGGVEITSISDIPSQGTGLGSSSSYTVGLLNALHAYVNRHVDASRLGREACSIELDRCRKPIGKQDQYIAAFGGLQYIQFNPDETVYADPVICKPETKRQLEQSLLLLYTGRTRSADSILREQSARAASDQTVASGTRKLVHMARELREALSANQPDALGSMMHEAWTIKKDLASGISNPEIDAWYERARAEGAMGGKILGAGGGGFLLVYASPERHAGIIAALPALRPIDFRFEPQGSKIIYVEEAPWN